MHLTWCTGGTRGTEISQYLEEKKTIVIPLVATSEKGKAQTMNRLVHGVVGLQYGTTDGSGRTWNCPPEKVKVLYTKLEAVLGDS